MKISLSLLGSILLVLFSSCNQQIDDFANSLNQVNKSNFLQQSYIIKTEDGKLIELKDTTLHIIDGACFENHITITESIPNPLALRGATHHEVYGYDSLTEGEYFKGMFQNCEQYGLDPAIVYLYCRPIITKQLYAIEGSVIMPDNYASLNNAPMGWIPNDPKNRIGFETTSTVVNNSIEAKTRLTYVNCDLAGKKVDIYMRHRPEDLLWSYTLFTAN